MCKKQYAVSHSSAESEILSLDAGFTRKWFTRASVLGKRDADFKLAPEARCNARLKQDVIALTCREVCFFFLRTLITVWQLFSVSPQLTRLYLLEDNAAVIQMIMKGLSPSWRHGTRTHGVDLDWLFERTNLHHSVIFVKMRTNDHLVDFVHQGSFSSQHWKRQLLLCEIHPSVHSAVVSQRQYLRKMFDPWRAQTTIFP